MLFVATLIALAIAAAASAASAQERATIIFHGDVSVERQAEIRARFDAVADWLDETYDARATGLRIHIGADLEAITPLIVAGGQDVPTSGAPCFWSNSEGYLLVDGCEEPLPFARLNMSEITRQLAYSPAAVVEDGHSPAGPRWLVHGAEEYAASTFRDAVGEASIDAARRDQLDHPVTLNVETLVLAELETSAGFYAQNSRPIAWLAVDYLVSQAGADSYVRYFRERAQHERWEDAFEAAFGLSVGEFYVAFAEYPSARREAERNAARDAWLTHWWETMASNGSTAEATFDSVGQLLAWYGVDAPASFIFRIMPEVASLTTWSPTDGRYLTAFRDDPSTHADVGDVRRNSGMFVTFDANNPTAATLPTAVHHRVRLEPGWNLVPWLGADGASLDEIRRGIGTLAAVAPARLSASSDVDQRDQDGPRINRGDLLWVAVREAATWRQGPARPMPGPAAVSAEATLALLDNPEAAEIAQAEFVTTVEGNVTEEQRRVIRARLADGIAFFRERFDTPPVLIDLNIFGPDYLEYRGCGTGGGEVNLYLWCGDWIVTGLQSAPADTETLVHEYFHVLQGEWNRYFNGDFGDGAPLWLSEGAAFYSELAYWLDRGTRSYEDVFEERAEASRGVAETLSHFAKNWGHDEPPDRYNLAFLAVTRLLERSDDPDLWLKYWYPWEGRSQRDVFEAAFGITLEDFYEEFAAWRAEHFPPSG